MKLADILTSDELKELRAIKPVGNVIYVPEHIHRKVRSAERGQTYKFKAIQLKSK